MNRFSRKSRASAGAATVDMEVAHRAAEAVNRGDVEEANRIVEATPDPQAHAFAAFRFIDNES